MLSTVLLAEKKKAEEKTLHRKGFRFQDVHTNIIHVERDIYPYTTLIDETTPTLNDWHGTEKLPKAVFASNCQANLKQTFEMEQKQTKEEMN